jgi:hypothetical protein
MCDILSIVKTQGWQPKGWSCVRIKLSTGGGGLFLTRSVKINWQKEHWSDNQNYLLPWILL